MFCFMFVCVCVLLLLLLLLLMSGLIDETKNEDNHSESREEGKIYFIRAAVARLIKYKDGRV